MKGQAMIIDALFFLMLCGASAGILAWASSVYGNEALGVYRYLYLIDVEASTIQVLGGASYEYNNNENFWIDQLGRYLAGEFNETDKRFKLLLDEWNKTCVLMSNPLIMEVYPENKTETKVCDGGVCASYSHPLVFTCRNPSGESVLAPVLAYQTCQDVNNISSIIGNSGSLYYDLGSRAKHPIKNLLFLKKGTGIPSTANKCTGGGIRQEPPYYSSPSYVKLCHGIVCKFVAKIYY